MAVLEDIEKEKQRLSERLARLDAQREKLAQQFADLESAERVLSRFSTEGGQRRGRPARAAAAAKTPKRAPRRARGRARTAPAGQGPSVSDAVLTAVRAHPEGISASDVMKQLTSEGLAVRPNQLGIALQRHKRGGRLEQRDGLWYPPQQSEGTAA